MAGGSCVLTECERSTQPGLGWNLFWISKNLVLSSNSLKKLGSLFLDVVFVQRPPEDVKNRTEIT